MKFAALQPQLAQLRSHPSYIQFTMGSKVRVSLSQKTFQPLHEKTAKYYCIVSSVHNLFLLVHNEVKD